VNIPNNRFDKNELQDTGLELESTEGAKFGIRISGFTWAPTQLTVTVLNFLTFLSQRSR
jgi:hypothetical protein